MKKHLKRAVALLLAVTLVCSLCSVAVFADSEVPQYKNYVSVGDSITAGTTLDGVDSTTYDQTLAWAEEAYPALLRKDVGADGAGNKSYQGGRAGFRTNEMRILLEDDYEGDAFTVEHLPDYCLQTLELIKAHRSEYREAIAAADLITVMIGSNDLLGPVLFAAADILAELSIDTPFETMIRDLLARLAELGWNADALLEIIDTADKVGMYAELVARLVPVAEECMESFQTNFDLMMEDIYALNSKVDVAVGGIFLGEEYTTGIVGVIVNPYLSRMNYFLEYSSRYCTRYSYVDLTGVDLSDSTDTFHPSPAGHRYIADQIIEVLKTINHCEHRHTMRLFSFPASLTTTVGYTGDVFCTDCGAQVEQGELTTKYGIISMPSGLTRTIVAALSKVVSRVIGDVFTK